MRCATVLITLVACGPSTKTDESWDVEGTVTAIVIQADAGTFAVTGAERDGAHLEQGIEGVIEHEASFADGVLTLTYEGNGDPGVRLAIEAPHDVAIDAMIGAGELTVTGVSGPLVLDLSAGELVGDALGATAVDVRGGDGDVTLGFEVVPTDLFVDQTVGDVEIRVPAGVYRLDLDIRVGDIVLDGVEDSPVAPDHIAAAMGAGDLTITGF